MQKKEFKKKKSPHKTSCAQNVPIHSSHW